MNTLWRVTIVGRPNVGKSSLFNAITGHRIAIVSDTENTTRDIIDYVCIDEELDFSFILADSGGLVQAKEGEILDDVRHQAERAIAQSDLILFVLEFDKLTDLDDEIAKLLRRSKKPVLVVANKADNRKREIEGYELIKLGFGDPISVSVAQNRGIRELKTHVIHALKANGVSGEYTGGGVDETVKLAIIGRPNVGKSSLVNAITGEHRMIVKDLPGTTRDSVDTEIIRDGKRFLLIDTAGIRRSGKIGTRNIENWSVMRSEKAIERCDVVALVIDAYEGITAQDQHIAGLALEYAKGVILVFNKWDKVLAKPGIDGNTIMNRYLDYIQKTFNFLSYAMPIFTSAIDGKRIDNILENAYRIRQERLKRVKTSTFNDFIEEMVYRHPPTGNRKSHKPKIYYGSQVEIDPPKFLLSVNNATHFHFSYARYLENKIRENFGFEGTPIRIEYKSRESIYKNKTAKLEPAKKGKRIQEEAEPADDDFDE